MLLPYFHKKNQKRIAWMVFYALLLQMGTSNTAHALTSGPVQPEAHGFEPVGTTDMVDPFTGDFVYNIPLLDVEGYPINIAYHGGVGLDQEASWVGLGWNITPGAVNRAVRGLPDDFDGETIAKEINIKPDKTLKVGINKGFEILGKDKINLKLSGSLGLSVNISNYRGVSANFNTNISTKKSAGFCNLGFDGGFSLGSQTGASLNYNLYAEPQTTKEVKKESKGLAFNANYGGNYNPRIGMHTNLGFSGSWKFEEASGKNKKLNYSARFLSANVPIGLQNFTSVLSNVSYMNTITGQYKFGLEKVGLFHYMSFDCTYSKTIVDPVGDLKGYGYFNLQNSNKNSLLDFSRDKDHTWNITMHYLPLSSLTYDIYDVSGQGTGGNFRPFRNDIGSVFDPILNKNISEDLDIGLEGGFGSLFEFGIDLKNQYSTSSTGPWDTYSRNFTQPRSGSYENYYFKQAGELSENNETYLNHNSGNNEIITPAALSSLPIEKVGSTNRVVRSNYIYAVSGKDIDTPLLLDSKYLYSYTTNGFSSYPSIVKEQIKRVDTNTVTLGRKKSHITSIIQVQKDGRKYVYGLPVVNNVQREATFAIDNNNADSIAQSINLVNYQKDVDDNMTNPNGLDNFYASTVTPTYVTTNLLTGVLSNDYVDVTGDGISDDDLGAFTKFNYTRKSKDYRWRSPAQTGKANYIPGFFTDKKDDKAAYMIGSREQWYLHSIETKNYVAEFYVSVRSDAQGVSDAILGSSPYSKYKDSIYRSYNNANDNKSYKLDSIVLYNKHDRFANGASAKAIKTVYFTYDYSLCQGVPNSSNGKLTLKAIRFKFADSKLNVSAPYKFTYTNNYAYQPAAKDRWDVYKPNAVGMGNTLFPFTEQSNATNEYAKAWSLSEINLPSGGVIKVDYESDDYAYVQDKKAMEMFVVNGFGTNANYFGGNRLYIDENQPCLYLYFTRRLADENPNLTIRQNYLSETSLLYYNVPVELKVGRFEPIKGFAKINEIGACSDGIHGYLKMEAQTLQGSNAIASPIVYTALNTGRYNLPQILFPGQDPDVSNFQNILMGIGNSFSDLVNIFKNPIKHYMQQYIAYTTKLPNGFIRLNSPGLKKKGGGQRVKSIKFFDNWASMANGNNAVYGKEYKYTKKADDGISDISSGVASWEPSNGGDELPQHTPVYFTMQQGSTFPPNDPVELYQENPIGESFFPSPVVGYSKVTTRSINFDIGRSSQSEDIDCFYTAREFPIIVKASPINSSVSKKFMILISEENGESTQGYSIALNDMHGKQLSTEHWVIKNDTLKELVTSQKNEYYTNGNSLNNSIPTYAYNAQLGTLETVHKKLGVETDLTIDSRHFDEVVTTIGFGANLNVIQTGPVPIPIPSPSIFFSKYKKTFQTAIATKVTQQYGILQKVIQYNQGANTELRNEVFDPQTGNVLLTSVNNEFGDRQYQAKYPAYWAYKELGLVYASQNIWDSLTQPLKIDSLGAYANRLVNYNTSFSSKFSLPSNMPVGLTIVDEQMPKFGLGDEILLYLSGLLLPPTRVWVMGYTSDLNNCYVVLAPREPYKLPADAAGLWTLGNTINPSTAANHLQYRIVQSGKRNRTEEVIQSFTTMNVNNVLPSLKNDLTDLITIDATRYNHNLNQVFAAHVNSDSLNPYVTGKVGLYRPEMEILNLKKRDYSSGLNRSAGLFNSKSYWQIEQDNNTTYCPDSLSANFYPFENCPSCNEFNEFIHVIQKLEFIKVGNSIQVNFETDPSITGSASPVFEFEGWKATKCTNTTYPLFYPNMPGYNPYNYTPSTPTNNGTFTISDYFLSNQVSYTACNANRPAGLHLTVKIYTSNGVMYAIPFYIAYVGQGPGNDFNIIMPGFADCSNPSSPVLVFNDLYQFSPSVCFDNSNSPWLGGYYHLYPSPYRVHKKIQLGIVGHYDNADDENWVAPQRSTLYNWNGSEIENKDLGLGYNAAIYGYNQQLPICVVKNARHSEVLFDGFEDYALLRPVPSIRATYERLDYSPFAPFFSAASNLSTGYKLSTLQGSFTNGNALLTKEEAHTGWYALKVTSGSLQIALNGAGTSMTNNYSFHLKPAASVNDSNRYVASVWLKPITGSTSLTPSSYGANLATITIDPALTTSQSVSSYSLVPKTTIIDGWQQYEVVFSTKTSNQFILNLQNGYYYDDFRITPLEANSKAFVYDPFTWKLMSSLDENNFATFYEYDAEGNLIRTKKETEKGIVTLSETRSTHKKN